MTPANCPRCGGRLARDNDSGRCAPCQAAERDRLSTPPVLPESFWSHPPLQAALTERHLGRVIRAYRHHPYHGRAALPQAVVAGWLGITQAQLSRVENGPPLVHLDRLTHWAQLLRVPANLLWFSLPASPQVEVARAPGPSGPPQIGPVVVAQPGLADTVGVSANGEVVPTDRRRFSTLAALVGLASTAHLDLLARLKEPPSAIGMEHVRLASSLVNEFRQADAAVGANELCDIAIQVHARLSEWAAKARYSRDVGDALQSALADLAVEAAWLAIDSERRATARPYLNEAIARARIADDPQVEVRALTHLALLMREAQPNESLHCADVALRASAGWATPRLRTLLHLRRAHTFAVLQDASGYERAMAKARHELDRGPHDDDQGFIHFVNDQEVQGIRGLSYLCLGQAGRAAEAFRAVTTNPSPTHRRNQTLYAVHLIDATRQQGDVNQAARMALSALPAAKQMRSQRVTKHLARIRSNLGRLERPTATVRQFAQAYDRQATR